MLNVKLLSVRSRQVSITSGTIVASSTGGTIAIPYPTIVVPGALLITDGYSGSAVPTTPSGWNATYVSGYRPIFFKIATGSESGSLSVVTNSTSSAAAIMYQVLITNSTPVILGEQQGYDTSPTITPTNTIGNGLDVNLLCMGYSSRTASVTSPTPTSTLATRSTSPTLYAFCWNNNTSAITTSTSSSINWRLININIQ